MMIILGILKNGQTSISKHNGINQELLSEFASVEQETEVK